MFGGLSAEGASAGGSQGAEVRRTATSVTSIVPGDPGGGQPDCSDFGFAHGFKVEPVTAGPHVGDGNTVTISDLTVVNGVMTFDFTATTPVSAVFVKSGPGGILYTFDPPVTMANDLQSPNDSISHLLFCWNDVPPTTTTTMATTTTTMATTTTTMATTTTKPTTTTTMATTTTKPTTTTTMGTTTTKPTTTTTMGTTTTKPSTTVTTAPSTTTTVHVAPTTTVPTLPKTGSTSTGPQIALGLGLLAAGALLLANSRRLRRAS